MNCLYCGQKLSGNQNPELGSFCSADHQRKFGVDIRVLLQLQNPGRLEIPRPESTASSNCLYCLQPLSIRKRLKGWQFCNSDHEDLYYRLWNEQAMARLGGAAALEEDLYGVELTGGDPQAIPRCQYCNEPLSVGRRLKRRKFCSEEHEEQYRQQQSSLVFSRLRAEDRPRARPRRLWDPRNTEGCAGFEPMPVTPKPGRLTLYPAEGIQFSVSPSILRFGGEILKLASGGAVARPRLRGLTLGRTEVAAGGRVDLKIAVPPRPAVICRLGEPAVETPGKLIVLPRSAGCAAIREDLPEAVFAAQELPRPPRDGGFLDYPRTQIPERFRRPLWMPRMAVASLGPAGAEATERQKEAASQQSAMDPPAPAGRLREQRWEAASAPPALVSGGSWIGTVESLLLPRAGGPPAYSGRLTGGACSELPAPARSAGERVLHWSEKESGRLNMPRQLRETPRYAAPARGPEVVSSGASDCRAEGRAERDWVVARGEAALPEPAKIRAGEQLQASVPHMAAWVKDCRRGAGQETFVFSGSCEAILPRMGAVASEGRWGAAGFRAVRGTREFSMLPRGTADGFEAIAAAVAVPKIEAMRGAESVRGAGYRNLQRAGPSHAMRANAVEWKQEAAPILVRRAAPWKALPWTGRGGGLVELTGLASSGWRTTQGLTWQGGGASPRMVYPAWPLASMEGRPLRRDHLYLMAAIRGLPSNRARNASCGDWMGVPGPLLPGAGQSRLEAAVPGCGYLRPAGTNPKRRAQAVKGVPFAGAGRVEMPKPLVNGAGLLPRTGERIGEWDGEAGARAAASGEWREGSLGNPRLPKPKEGDLTGMRPGAAAALGWRAGVYETEGLARELVIAYRFVFPAAAATELEQLPGRRRAGAKGKIVVLR
ncbi:MAG: hypothetical protein IT167_22015 [Bryobacterales bacterium]|nr:hypothetical protein [Bryobacterales bacterium]